MVPDRILSVNASIDTIGEILLKIIPTLEEVSLTVKCLVNVVINIGRKKSSQSFKVMEFCTCLMKPCEGQPRLTVTQCPTCCYKPEPCSVFIFV